MEVKGRIAAVMPIQQGTSGNGNAYLKQEFVLEYFWWPNQTTASKMVLNLFGEERVKSAELKAGEEVKVRYHIEAREYNGRWYNDVRCDSVERRTPKPEVPKAVDAPGTSDKKPAADATGNGGEQADMEEKQDDLPF